MKLKFFGKKKDTYKTTENSTNTGSETLKTISKIQELLYDDAFEIQGVQTEFYYSNGYWYKGIGKNKFIFLGKDVMFAGEQNFKA